MANLCQVGTEPKSDPNQRIRLTDGVFCEILGLQHPLCRLIDRVWFVLAGKLIDPPDVVQAPFPEARFWWSFATAFTNQMLLDAATTGLLIGDLCADEPPPPTPVTYFDLVNFLLGQDDAILVKVFEAWRFRVWFDHCRCKPNVVPSPPTIGFPPVAVPGVPYCGGVVSGPPPSAIQNCQAPLLARVQEIANENAIEGANFWNFANQVLADNPYQLLIGDYWVIGQIGYYGQIGSGWVLENFVGAAVCPQNFPDYMPVFPFGLRITCEDPAGKIELAVSGVGKLWIVRDIQRAESDLIPVDPDLPSIPKGEVLSEIGRLQWTEILSWCFHARITPYLPTCPPSGGRFGAWNTPGPDPKSDDEAICLDVPQLCSFRLPNCCGGETVLMDAENQIALATALGLISQGG